MHMESLESLPPTILIPDFAQVANQIMVLTYTFEVKFDNNASPFTEGTELLIKAGLFYSKRIGAQPHGKSRRANF